MSHWRAPRRSSLVRRSLGVGGSEAVAPRKFRRMHRSNRGLPVRLDLIALTVTVICLTLIWRFFPMLAANIHPVMR